MQITVVAAGKLKQAPARALADDYLARLARYCRVREVETRDDSGLAKAVGDCDQLVALEVWGKRLSSEGFASSMESWSSRGKGRTTFVIGAADGIPRALSQRADYHLSLSSMTLPHRLARVLLYEQLYRCMTILRGEPYARES